MSMCIISDVHVKARNDRAYLLLMDFLSHPKVRSSSHIFLLGDIFDFMCGGHCEYFEEYPEFFERLKILLLEKRYVYYLEGNHDFHLSRLFEEFLRRNSLDKNFFHHIRNFVSLKFEGKKYYLAHGDEVEIGNFQYMALKGVLNSPPVKKLINDIVPFAVLNFIGNNASKFSRNQGKTRQYDYSRLRNSFRQGAIKLGRKIGTDFIICGHSHIQDDFHYNDGTVAFRYLNNGFALDSKTFIYIEGHQVTHVLL